MALLLYHECGLHLKNGSFGTYVARHVSSWSHRKCVWIEKVKSRMNDTLSHC